MKENKNETMGMRIKKQRVALGMTQEMLAEMMSIPKGTVSAYENDRVDLKASTILELARHLGLTPNALLLGDPDDEGEAGKAYVEEVTDMLRKIKDPTARKIIFIEIAALVPKV